MHADCSECFNLYSSPDLGTWTFEVQRAGLYSRRLRVDFFNLLHLQGCVLKNEDIVAPQPGTPYYRMERPKIFKW